MDISSLGNDLTNLFRGYDQLKSIPKLITSSAIQLLTSICFQCRRLTDIHNLSELNLKSLQHIGYAFCDCESLETIDLDLSNVKNLFAEWAFADCTNLKDLSKLKIKSLGLVHGLCYGCEKLQIAPDLNLTPMRNGFADRVSNMFYKCKSLTEWPKINFPTNATMTWVNKMFENSNLDPKDNPYNLKED